LQFIDLNSAAGIQNNYEAYASPAESSTRTVAFATSQPVEVGINDILLRLTRQEL
jgi:hypothetical protein